MRNRIRQAGAVLLAAVGLCAVASPPAWWTNRGVLTADPANDYAPATAGQLKHIASKARDELEHAVPGGAGAEVQAIITGFQNADNYVPVTLGQLKRVAKPYYDRLIAAGLASGYPWTATTADDQDFAPANIGQVKQVFAFDLDADGDGLPGWWELQNGLNPADPDDADSDADGDGIPAAAEYGLGTLANQYNATVEKFGNDVEFVYRSVKVTRDKIGFPAFKRDAQAGIRRRYSQLLASGTFLRTCGADWSSSGEWSLARHVDIASGKTPVAGDSVEAEFHDLYCEVPPPNNEARIRDEFYAGSCTVDGLWAATANEYVGANFPQCLNSDTHPGTVDWDWDPLDMGIELGWCGERGRPLKVKY